MTVPRSYDAVVIGGGANGLVAATFLAKAGKKTLLLEARKKLGGLCAATDLGEGFSGATGVQSIHALDPLVTRELKLSTNGLRFANRELALVGLRGDGKHILISKDVHGTASSIAVHSQRDADAWPFFHKELFALARAMRPFWWQVRGTLPDGVEGQKIERIARMGAGAWLDSWFESDALKATLCFDSTAGGVSVLEPGSALSLVWRAAQEMSGLQGAVAIPQGSSAALIDALASSARAAGCELRTGLEAGRVILDGERVAGVQMLSGETCFAPLVFSAINSFHASSKLLPPCALGISGTETALRNSCLAEVRVVIALRSAPQIAAASLLSTSRFVLAERPEVYVAAEMTARNGDVANEIPVEFVIPTMMDASIAPPGQHILSVLMRPVPRYPAEGWSALAVKLRARVVASIERLVPGVSQDISNVVILDPNDAKAGPPLSVSHMLSTAIRRIETPIAGLFLCGADAEPVPAVSGRAARIAVGLAMALRS